MDTQLRGDMATMSDDHHEQHESDTSALKDGLVGLEEAAAERDRDAVQRIKEPAKRMAEEADGLAGGGPQRSPPPASCSGSSQGASEEACWWSRHTQAPSSPSLTSVSNADAVQ